jgi:hypothetical protein
MPTRRDSSLYRFGPCSKAARTRMSHLPETKLTVSCAPAQSIISHPCRAPLRDAARTVHRIGRLAHGRAEQPGHQGRRLIPGSRVLHVRLERGVPAPSVRRLEKDQRLGHHPIPAPPSLRLRAPRWSLIRIFPTPGLILSHRPFCVKLARWLIQACARAVSLTHLVA